MTDHMETSFEAALIEVLTHRVGVRRAYLSHGGAAAAQLGRYPV